MRLARPPVAQWGFKAGMAAVSCEPSPAVCSPARKSKLLCPFEEISPGLGGLRKLSEAMLRS